MRGSGSTEGAFETGFRAGRINLPAGESISAWFRSSISGLYEVWWCRNFGTASSSERSLSELESSGTLATARGTEIRTLPARGIALQLNVDTRNGGQAMTTVGLARIAACSFRAHTPGIGSRHTRPGVIVIIAALLMLGAQSAFGQLRIVGRISGTIEDQAGALVPKAKVVLKDEKTGITKEIVSSSEG